MPTVVDTSTVAAPTFGGTPQIDRCQNGVLWSVFHNGASSKLTLRLTVSADRVVSVLVTGESGAVLSGFEAWSNL